MLKKIFAFGSVCFVLTHCTENAQIKPQLSYFPNSIGLKYTYIVNDSTLNKSYRVIVSTKSIVNMPVGQSATLWEYQYPDHLDTNYVVSNADSAVFYNATKEEQVSKYYFPLTIGRKWTFGRSGTIGLKRDSVISNNPHMVLKQTLNNVYQIGEVASAGTGFINNTFQFSPNIGLVEQSTQVGGIVLYKASWILVAFSRN